MNLKSYYGRYKFEKNEDVGNAILRIAAKDFVIQYSSFFEDLDHIDQLYVVNTAIEYKKIINSDDRPLKKPIFLADEHAWKKLKESYGYTDTEIAKSIIKVLSIIVGIYPDQAMSRLKNLGFDKKNNEEKSQPVVKEGEKVLDLSSIEGLPEPDPEEERRARVKKRNKQAIIQGIVAVLLVLLILYLI